MENVEFLFVYGGVKKVECRKWVLEVLGKVGLVDCVYYLLNELLGG